MRTTVKLDLSRTLVIEPAASGVKLTLRVAGVTFDSFMVTPDQCGAAIFGMEQALEARELGAARDASYVAKYIAKEAAPC